MRVLHELRTLARSRGFRLLLAIRLTSQSGDGLFAVGLATLFIFSPQGLDTAGAVAGALAALLLPFTVIGPWAGVLLDRWRRRQVLVVGNLVRVGLGAAIVVLMLTRGVGTAVLVLALVAVSVNRFLLAGLSAALPRVVEASMLTTANSVTPSLGSLASGAGGAIGLLLGWLLPSGMVQDVAAVGLAAGAFGAAALVASRFGADEIGPAGHGETMPLVRELRRVGRGLVAGARYVHARGTPGRALLVMSAHRLLYGVTLIASLLMSRNLFTDPGSEGGLAVFSSVLLASGAGFAGAVVLTPLLSPRLGGVHRWIVCCLVVAASSQALLWWQVELWVLLVAVALLGLTAQGAKIAVDTIVHRDTSDTFRGRAFTLYDALYNAGFVVAAVAASVALPDTGASATVFALLTAGYLGCALWYGTRAHRPVVVPDPPAATG
ncbi:MAG TPA: hypothetical protein VK053_21650 [Jiangellaceae bacterium]|nr:hypothetical protein [Jiangellaceae bacterium]